MESPIFQMGRTEAQNALGACPGSPGERPCSTWGLARGTVGLGREGQLGLGQGVPSESCWWRACWQGCWAEPQAPEAGVWPQVQPFWGGCVCGGAGLTLSSSANWATRLWPHFCCWNSCLLSGQVFREGRGGAQVVLGSQRLPESGSREHQGRGEGPWFGAGRFFRRSLLCDLVKSLLLSEPQIDSAKSPQGLAWVI